MTKTMRGVMFLGHGQVEVREFPVPTPVGTQVLVQVKAAGICGSDMHRYHLKPEEIPPTIRGHEPSGVVAEVGDAVTFVKVGDRVSVYHAPACNHCEPCAQGYFFNCTTIGPGWRLGNKPHGGDADYVLVDQNVCFKLPDELNYEDGAIIACAGGTAYHALNRGGGVRGGQFVLVSRAGTGGLVRGALGPRHGGHRHRGRSFGLSPRSGPQAWCFLCHRSLAAEHDRRGQAHHRRRG